MGEHLDAIAMASNLLAMASNLIGRGVIHHDVG